MGLAKKGAGSGRFNFILHMAYSHYKYRIRLSAVGGLWWLQYTVIYTLDFRLKTQNNVPELAGLVHNKTYKQLVSHIMDQVIWPPALPKAPSVDTTKENHHIQ